MGTTTADSTPRTGEISGIIHVFIIDEDNTMNLDCFVMQILFHVIKFDF